MEMMAFQKGKSFHENFMTVPQNLINDHKKFFINGNGKEVSLFHSSSAGVCISDHTFHL